MYNKYKANCNRIYFRTIFKTNPFSIGTAISSLAKAAKQQLTKPQLGAFKGSRLAKLTVCASLGIKNRNKNKNQNNGEELLNSLNVSVQQAKLHKLLNNSKKQKQKINTFKHYYTSTERFSSYNQYFIVAPSLLKYVELRNKRQDISVALMCFLIVLVLLYYVSAARSLSQLFIQAAITN